MIIGVDAGCLGLTDKRLQVGVYQVAVNLLQQLRDLDKKNNYYLYSFAPIEKELLSSFGPRMKNVIVKPTSGWMKIWLPLRLAKDKPDVFLALSQVAPMLFSFSSPKVVGLIHDVAFKKYPALYPTSSKHDSETNYLIKRADKLVTVSEKTKEDLVTLYSANKEKIDVAYEGVRNLPKVKKKLDVRPFFLFAGALKKQKNIPTFLRAFSLFVQNTKDDVDLRIVGGDKWLDDEIATILQQLDPKTLEHIIFERFVDDKRLAELYSSAIAFVSPSLYEGFGLPFIEAMSFGCPVIGSTAGALPEVIGEAGLLVSPLDYEKLYDSMGAVYTDKTLRGNLAKKARLQARKFTWDRFAKTIFSIISEYER